MEKAKDADDGQLAAEGADEFPRIPSASLGTIQGIVTLGQSVSGGATHDLATANEGGKRYKPLKKVQISARCKGVGKKRTKTDGSGYYELTDLEDGKWELKVKAKGQKDIDATVEISGGGVYEKNFE
jgi:hypothetical protein